MNYKDVEIFLELVRTHNITKAAEQLYLSQSTVSNRLKSLEDELGCQLIVRAKGYRTVQLTRQGEEFVPVAERWKNLFEETELLKKASFSTLRIASSESTYYEILAPFLCEFFPRHPQDKVTVQVCDSELVYDLLEKNLIDYGFASYEAFRPDIRSRCIDCQPLCIICWSDDPQPGLTIRPDSLDPAKEIQFTGGHFGGMRLWREKWFGSARACRMEVNTSRGVIPFLEKLGYWAIAPLDIAEHLAKEVSLQIYRLEDEPEPWRIYLLKKQRSTIKNDEIRRTFEEELLAYIERLEKIPERSDV